MARTFLEPKVRSSNDLFLFRLSKNQIYSVCNDPKWTKQQKHFSFEKLQPENVFLCALLSAILIKMS